MRKSSKFQSILYLLLIIILLAVAVGGVSNLRNSIDEAFNNGGGSSSSTTQATDNGTVKVPVTTVPVTGNGVVIHTCEWDYSKPSNPQANDPHYTVYPCKYPSCSNFKAKYTQCAYDETCHCVICGAEGPHDFVEDYGGTAGNHTVVEVCSICGKGGSANSVGISCVDNDKDGFCDFGGCEMSEECSHNFVEDYGGTAGNHTVVEVCSICGAAGSANSVGVPCVDNDKDGLCDFGGCEMN